MFMGPKTASMRPRSLALLRRLHSILASQLSGKQRKGFESLSRDKNFDEVVSSPKVLLLRIAKNWKPQACGGSPCTVELLRYDTTKF